MGRHICEIVPRTFVLHLHCLGLPLSANINRACPTKVNRQREQISGRNVTILISVVLNTLGIHLSAHHELSMKQTRMTWTPMT